MYAEQIKRTFSTDFEAMRTNWKNNRYDWLPGPNEIPKQLGEILDPEYLQKLEIRSVSFTRTWEIILVFFPRHYFLLLTIFSLLLLCIQLDTALLDAYEFMQRFAVGLEQIVWDQEDHRLEFRKQFKDTEFNLRTVRLPFFNSSIIPIRNDLFHTFRCSGKK